VIKNYRRDGSSYWSRVQIGPMRDLAGKITLIVGVQCEVSEVSDTLSFKTSLSLPLVQVQTFLSYTPNMPLSNSCHCTSVLHYTIMMIQVDAPTCESNTSSDNFSDERASSNSSDDGNGCGGSSCSWNGSTISAGSGCNDSRSDGEQEEDGTSEGGTNEEEYPPA
jgi:hypothetical protein